MKKTILCLLMILIGMAPAIPAVARADTSQLHQSEHSSVKSRKAYLKHQKKQMKKARHQQKKSAKEWKKQHDAAR